MDFASEFATQFSIFTTRFLGIFIEAVAFLLLGSLVAGLIAVFIRNEDIARLMPRNPVAAVFVGSLLGFIFPVCECGVVPVTRRLYQKGLPVATGVTFLLAAPVMNPIVLASTWSAFGVGPVLIGRFVITFIIAVSIGLLFTLQTRPQRMLNPRALANLATSSGGSSAAKPKVLPGHSGGRPDLLPGLREALRIAGDDFFDMGKYLIVGCALAAGMQTFIAQDALKNVATNPVTSVLAMAGLAFVLSLCSTTDAILALSFANPIAGGGFTIGSILTFLTFGPMVDIKSMAMYLGIFSRKTVLYMTLLPLLISVLIGIWLNLNVRF
ncbi:MAG: permease [Anaerolineae bacterium]|nr:permease [Anaerolineae bacterium]